MKVKPILNDWKRYQPAPDVWIDLRRARRRALQPGIEYYPLDGRRASIQRSMQIDGEYPFIEAGA